MGDDYKEEINRKHESIINNLQELQAVESYLFSKIQDAASSTAASKEKDNIASHVTNLTTTRTNLLKELQNLYSSANDDVNIGSKVLGQQSNMSQHLNGELDKQKQKLKALKAEKNNKQRMAQIGEYEYSKNVEHKSILKVIVYGSFFVLLIVFLNSKNILPQFLTRIFIVIICFFVFLRIIKKLFWNFQRDNIDYSKFRHYKKKNEVYDKKTKNTFNLSNLLGLDKQCKDTSLESDVINNQLSYNNTHNHSPPHEPTDLTQHPDQHSEGFSLLNTSKCKSCKNIYPVNNLNNNTFKITSLKYSTIN